MRDSGNANALQSYLGRYPNGAFTDLAALKLAALGGDGQALAATSVCPALPATGVKSAHH